MIDKKTLIGLLPPVQWADKTEFANGSNSDIISVLQKLAPQAVAMVKPIAQFFKGNSPEQTAKNIHSFIRANLGYRRDPAGVQQIRLPNRYLIESGDCKNVSLFIYSVLSCIYPGNVYFRFVNYDKLKAKTPSHVYIALKVPGKKDIVIDGTYKRFNKEVKPNFKRDMKIQTLSDNADGIAKLNLGKKLKSVGKAVGKVAKVAVKPVSAVAKVTAKAGKATGKAVGKAGKATGKAVGKAAVATGKATAKAGKAVGKAAVTVVKKGVDLAKKAALAPARGAYLALVAMNVHSFATKLDKGNQSKIKSNWESLGGDYNVLKTNIGRGKGKRPIAEDMTNRSGIGEPVSVSLATAAPVIAVMSKLFGSGDVKEDLKKLSTGAAKGLVNKATSGNLKNLSSGAKKALSVVPDSVKSAIVTKAASKVEAAAGLAPGTIVKKATAETGSGGEQNEAEGSEPAGMSTKKKLLIGAGIAAAAGLGYMAMKGKRR